MTKAEAILKWFVEGEKFPNDVIETALKVQERWLMTLDQYVD